MEALLKKELGTSTLKPSGYIGVGCISEGQSYDTDSGRIFVKINRKNQARLMFDGEAASLDAILKTEIVKVPKPIKVIDLEAGGAMFVMEHLDMRSLSKYSAKLGDQLADLHLHNQRQREWRDKEEQTVGKGSGQSDVPVIEKFGFHTATCNGFLPQVNEWQSDWVAFFTRYRLQHQLGLLEQSYGDREVRDLWAQLQLRISKMFEGVEVYPALLHGDLHGCNVAEDSNGPIIFDPCCFYGHAEFELTISAMFGGFDNSFYSAYYKKLPKAPGFEKRYQLYQLYNYLNHWNHFGTEYREATLRTMRKLLE
ncbi:hypothetical protein GJAV_G00220920 [Gymnothorax javanicus]|nr:hypothetical protein GJAV_G00220920 [Gymnothorax javanicus]